MHREPRHHIRPLARPFTIHPQGARLGVLLVHGFADTPYSMRDLGLALSEQGYAVTVVRLPGHGSRIEHLRRVGLAEWRRELRRSLDTLRSRTGRVVIIGRSFGGVLALLEAAERPGIADGIVLVSTPNTVQVSWWIRRLLPIIGLVRPYVKKPWLRPHDAVERLEVGRYPGFPISALRQFFRGLTEVRRAHLERVTQPVLLVHSDDDPLAPPQSVAFFLQRLGSQRKETLWLHGVGHRAERIHTEPAFRERLQHFLQSIENQPA